MNLSIPTAKSQQPSMRPAVPLDLLKLWDQSGIEHDGRDTSWFFNPQMQEVLRFVIKINTVEGQPRLKKFGGWELTIHQVGCMHLAYNFPGIATEEERLTTALLAGLHDSVEDPREVAQAAGQLFGRADEDQIYDDIVRLCKYLPVFRRVLRGVIYMTDADCFDDIADKCTRKIARIQAQIDKSFDPATGECLIEPLLQRARAVDKIDQLGKDVMARGLGLLPDDRLDNQVENAIRKSFILRLPVVLAHPEIADTYWANVAYLEDELAIAKVAALQKAISARQEGKLTDVGLEEELIKAKRNPHVIINRHPELLTVYNEHVAVLENAFATTHKKSSVTTDYYLSALNALGAMQHAVRTASAPVLQRGKNLVNSGLRWVNGVNL